MKILFVGNSFTYYNDMPTLFQNMANACNLDVQVDKLTFGGHYLHQYADFESEKGMLFLKKLNEGNFDIVVLQDQSINPALNYDDFFTAAQKLCNEIRKKGAVPIFYQTWAYRNESEKLKHTGFSYDEMHEKLENAYQTAAKQLDTIAVPVGRAFYNITKNRPDVNLLAQDDYHPSCEGSLVAASVFLNTIKR